MSKKAWKHFGLALVFSLFMNLYLSGQNANSDSSFVQFFYPNRQVSSEGVMKKGQPDGYWRTYYVTGVIKSEGKRTNYLLDSVWSFYNQSGELVQSISYSIGEKNGFSVTYRYDNPKKPGKPTIISKELYVNGKREGPSYYYYLTGELREIVQYRENKKQGLAREFSPDSTLITVQEFNDNYLVNRERINRTDAQGRKQGTFRDYYENGSIRKEENYLDNQLHGYYREYDGRGELLMAMRYERGQIVEEIDEDLKELLDMKSTFDEQGRLLFTGGYKEGIPVGIHRFFDTAGVVVNAFLYNELGQKISEGVIDEQGRRKGSWTDFYPTGEVRAKGDYNDNQQSGTWTFYYLSGAIEQKGRFERGRYQGLWMWYYPNGNTWREESYFNGREDGLFVEYGPDGSVLTQGDYISGERDGEWIYHVGDHQERGSYVIGLREGIWKYYYPDGGIKYEGFYSQGNPDKRHKYYYPSGILMEEQYYEMGIREKNWKKYDDQGNLVMTITYNNDVEQRINGIRIRLPESDITLIR
jgi:antitoxin component YwqK of YwqJK toxin-antitoxin module